MSPNFRSFGNGSEEIFYGILLSERLKKKILFIYPRLGILSIANQELYYLEHENIISHKSSLSITFGVLFEIYVLILWFIDFIKCSSITKTLFTLFGLKNSQFIKKDFGYIIPTIGKEKLWVPAGNNKFCSKNALNLNWSKQYKNFQPPKINANKLEIGNNFLFDLGLPKNQWFVCLHVRERKNKNEVRNAEIKNYIKAINYIISKGGFVIRIGDPDSPKLPKMKNLIDYANSKNRTPLIDLVILSNCNFILGTGSGPNMAAHLFDRKVIGSNLTEWSHSISFCKISILKHFRSKKENKILSIREMLNAPYHIQRVGNYLHKDYELIDNSPEEIELLVKSQLESLGQNLKSQFQQEFDRIKIRQLLKHLDEGDIKNWYGLTKYEYLTQQYRFFALSMYEGVVEKNFLDRNW